MGIYVLIVLYSCAYIILEANSDIIEYRVATNSTSISYIMILNVMSVLISAHCTVELLIWVM